MLSLGMLLWWATPEVLRRLKRLFEPMIESLDQGVWERLYLVCRYMWQACGGRYSGLNEEWFHEAKMVSTRSSLILVLRVKEGNSRRRLARKLFCAYEGNDQTVLHFAADSEVQSILERSQDLVDDDWDYLCRLSKLARKGGIPFLFSVTRSERRWRISEKLASAVLSDCENHCGQFVALCERSYRMAIAERMASVSEISSRDGWFTVE